jgi:hypothetical protein
MPNADDVIRESLIERINQLNEQVGELLHNKATLTDRVCELEIAVNNILAVADKETQANYRHLLRGN